MRLLSKLKGIIIPSFRIDVSKYLWDKEMSREQYDRLISPATDADEGFMFEEALSNLGQRHRIIRVNHYL